MSERAFHEDFSGHTVVTGSTNRTFGLVFALAFIVAAAAPLIDGASMRVWPLPVAAVLAAIALAAPDRLAPLNRAWTALGLRLGKVVNPLVMGIVFFVIFTPVAMIMRLFGRDPLHLRPPASLASAWV